MNRIKMVVIVTTGILLLLGILLPWNGWVSLTALKREYSFVSLVSRTKKAHIPDTPGNGSVQGSVTSKPNPAPPDTTSQSTIRTTNDTTKTPIKQVTATKKKRVRYPTTPALSNNIVTFEIWVPRKSALKTNRLERKKWLYDPLTKAGFNISTPKEYDNVLLYDKMGNGLVLDMVEKPLQYGVYVVTAHLVADKQLSKNLTLKKRW